MSLLARLVINTNQLTRYASLFTCRKNIYVSMVSASSHTFYVVLDHDKDFSDNLIIGP